LKNIKIFTESQNTGAGNEKGSVSQREADPEKRRNPENTAM